MFPKTSFDNYGAYTGLERASPLSFILIHSMRRSKTNCL